MEIDHKLLYVDVTALQPTHCKTKEPLEKTKKKRQPKANKSLMRTLKKVTRKDPFWKVLESVCDRKSENCEIEQEHTVEEVYTTLRTQSTTQ